MDREERKKRDKAVAAERRRNQILDAGKKLFSTMSPGEVTISAIARECALSAGTIYLYFESKDDLLFHIMTEYMSSGLELFLISDDLSGIENLEKMIGNMKMDYMENLPMKNLGAHFDLYFEKEYPDLPIVAEFEKLAQDLNDRLEQLIEKGREDGSIKSDLNPRLYGCLIGNMAGTFGTRTALRRDILTRNQKMDPFEEYSLALDLILEALRK